MSQQLMTLEEKAALLDAVQDAEDRGDFEEAEKLIRKLPLAPGLAKGLLESDGLESVLERGFNLSEAEALYGKEWLQQYRP